MSIVPLRPLLSVVFSFRDEEAVLPELIRRTRAVLRPLVDGKVLGGYELIFVNDASVDNSLAILLDHAREERDIRIINMSRAFGVSPCVMAGLAYAKGDGVVYMDADLQDPPELIPELIAAWQREDHVDVVHTVRRTRRGESGFKIFVTRLGYMLLNKFSSIELPLEAGDFKLLSRRAVHYVLQLKETRPFMRGLVRWVGFKQVFVTYDREPRYAGRSKFKVFGMKVIHNFFGSALISFSSVPLQLASFMGLFTILIDFGLMAYALSEKIKGKAIPGWTALMIVILFLGGVQLFCTGIIGMYINSIHEQSKNRPNYIIESTFGFTDPPDESVSADQPMIRDLTAAS